MVALFVSLKWRLLTSRLRHGPRSRRIGAVVGLALAVIAAAIVALSLSLLRRFPETALITGALVLVSQLVAWMLTPLIAFGVDETVDPQRFALLPLRRRTMLAGLTVSALVGWLPLINIVVLLGVAVMISPTWSMLPISLLCMVLQVLMLVVLSRATSTSLADLMSTRRGRDLGMLVGFGVFVVYLGVSAGLGQLSRLSGIGSGVSTVAEILGWTPPGALARIPGLAADGDWGHAALLLLLPLAAIALGYVWWSKALTRAMESGPSTTESSSPAGEHDFGGATDGTARVVAARDSVLIWRHPMRRLPWLMVLVFLLGMPFLWIRGHGALFAVAFGALMSGTQVGNQFGVDGSGMWLHLMAIGDRARARAEMLGHLLVVLIPGAVLVTVAVFLCAVVRGDLPWVPAALGGCLSCLIGAAGMASYLSAKLPYAMPQNRSSMFASAAPQHKTRAFGVSMGVLFGGLAVALPGVVFVPLAVTVAPFWGWVGLVVGPVVSSGITWLLLQKGSTVYFESAPEIFAEVKLGDRI